MSFTQTPDPKKMQINLTGFLTDSTSAFMVALWNLLIEAQASPAGIPRSFVEEKKEEMRRAKEGDTRALTERDRRTRLDEVRGRERSERAERGGGRGRGRGRRGRGGIGNDSRPDNRTRDNGWSSRGGAVSHLPIPHTNKFLIFFRSSVLDIVLPAVRVRLGHGAGHRRVIALLARVVLPVALVLAVQFVHVRSLRLRDVDHPRRGARRLHHHAVAVAARHHSHLVTMNGIVGPEGATAAAHQCVADGSVRQHVAVVPVEAQTVVVAGAVQAPVALEGIVLHRVNGHHHVGEEARGTGASAEAEAEAGAQRTEGKGHRVGVEAGLGVRASAFPAVKVGAKKVT